MPSQSQLYSEIGGRLLNNVDHDNQTNDIRYLTNAMRTMGIQMGLTRGTVIPFMRGIADSFIDTAGVAYNEINQSLPTMTSNTAPSGYSITFSSSTGGNEDGYKAFDGITNGGGGAAWVAGSGAPAWIQRTNSLSYTMYAYNVYGRNDGYGSPVAWTLYGSNDGGNTLTVLDTQTGQNLVNAALTQYVIPLANRAPFTSYRMTITTARSGNNPSIAELQFLKASTNNDSVNLYYVALNRYFTNYANSTTYAGEMRSATFNTDTPPVSASIFFGVQVPSGTLNLNTNVVAGASRDGGTTWTNFNLINSGVFNGNIYLEADNLNISSQPTGSNTIRYRIVTDTSIVLQVYSMVYSWS